MSEPHRFRPFWARRVGGVVTVHGEIDIATCDLFAAVVGAAVEHADAQQPPGDAHLDLAGLDFIGVAGTRVLVVAASKRLRGLELIVHHPPVMLERIIEVGWGQVSGLTLQAPPSHRQTRDPRRVATGGTAAERASALAIR